MRISIDTAIEKQSDRMQAEWMSCALSCSIAQTRLNEIYPFDRLAAHRRICDQIDAELTNLRKHVQSLRREMTLLERVRDKKENGVTSI